MPNICGERLPNLKKNFIYTKNRNHTRKPEEERLMLGDILKRCTGLSQLSDVFRMLFDANLIGVTVVRADGVILYYNEAQARLDGLSAKDVLDKKICDVYRFTPEDSPTMRALRTGKPIFDTVHLYRTRNGKLVNSSNSIYPLWGHGVLLGAICFIQSYTAIGRQVGYMRATELPEGKDSPPGPARERNKARYTFDSLVGESHDLREAAVLAKKVSGSSSSVMLIGETGVGKEIFAQAIHYASPRQTRSYTAINCSAVPETLLEGILFGTVKGAFTGAVNRPGLFEVANGGTLYLDEIGSMPVSLQNKLLRVLQERRIRRVGEGHERPIDVRIISSVGRNPVALVEAGLLRRDFYYRLGVVKILIPSLRSRMEDIHPLVQHFLQLHSSRLGTPQPLITPEAMAVFYAHSWPGNVRELEHAIEASLALVDPGDNLEPWHLYRAVPDFLPVTPPLGGTTPWLAFQDDAYGKEHRAASVELAAELSLPPENAVSPATPSPTAKFPVPGKNDSSLPGQTLAMEAASIAKALKVSAGNVAMAARLLGISPQLLHYKIKKHAIDKRCFLPERL